MRTAMAEPRTSLHMWKGSIILLVVLVNILVRLYTISGEKGSLLLDQLTRKDHISYKKAVEKKSTKDHRRY
jgi:non-homologous end joining protein Ku